MSRSLLIPSEILVAAPAAALVASTPAAFRLAGDRFGLLESWFAAAGLLCPLLVLLVAAARGARRAVRSMAPPARMTLVAGAAVWALMSLPATSVAGAVLKANTHHRALAGATFAVAALVVQLGAALVAWRITALLLPRLRRPAARTFVALALGAAALVLVAVSLTRAALAQDASAGSAVDVTALLVDGAFVFAASVAAALLDVPTERRSDAAWLGGGALMFVTAVGLVLASRSSSLARDLVVHAPLAGAVAEAVGLSPERSVR
jgi:hypothetical protein